MTGSVNAINASENNKKKVAQTRPEQIIVKSGDSMSSIAKKFGLTTQQFMQWTGLKKSTLMAGQKINLPMSEVPKGKGIMTLIRENNMTMEEFGKLNNLPKPYKDYKASVGEKFYVINHSDSKPSSANNSSRTSSTSNNDSSSRINNSSRASQDEANSNKTLWGSSYTPDEIATNLYNKSCEYYGAVGKPDFDALVNEINSKNVSEVIKSYEANPQNKDKESLINTIVSEVSSDKDKRKAAVMKVYDAVAKKYGTPASVREGFVKELNEQFDSFGMVSTKKLDETINRIMASPQELAAKMEHDIDHKSAAVGKDSFNELLSLVNSKNAAQVIKAYDDLKTGESLINGITSEIGSSKKDRKKAVMHIYDSLAAQKGTQKSNREVFEQELNKQFDSFGMVSTKELDKMIKDMVSKPDASAEVNNSNRVTNNEKVKFDNNPEVKTGEQWRQGAIASGKKEALEKYKEFCIKNNIKFDENDLDLSPMDRFPAPVSKNGKVIADISPVLKPTTIPNGKVVILNPGHGGYSSRSGNFDPGSYSFIKKGNGKYAPLLEYEKMNDYADKAAEKLRAEGYTVIITNAHAETISDQKTVKNLINNLASGKLTNQKYDKKDIVFVSLHADSEPGSSGSGICFDSRYSDDTKLARTFKNSLNEDDWIKAGTTERVWGKNGIQVLHQSESCPSVLVEVEYVNGSKSKNLDSSAFQGRFLDKLTVGLNRYFNFE